MISFLIQQMIDSYQPSNVESRLLQGEKIMLRGPLQPRIFHFLLTVFLLFYFSFDFKFQSPSIAFFDAFGLLIIFFLLSIVQRIVASWLNTTYLTQDGFLRKGVLYSWNEIVSMKKVSTTGASKNSINTVKGSFEIEDLIHPLEVEPLIIKMAQLEQVPKGTLHDTITDNRWQKIGHRYQEFTTSERVISFLSYSIPDKYEQIIIRIILWFGIPAYMLFQYFIAGGFNQQ